MLASKDIKKLTELLASKDDVNNVKKRLENIEELIKEITKRLKFDD